MRKERQSEKFRDAGQATDSLLLHHFQSPPRSFGPVPFYWWAGEALDRARLSWQLDLLRAKGIHQVLISYPHGPDGRTELGAPPLFSAAWWDLLRWFLAECRRRDMSAGFQDYTLIGPILQAIGAKTPEMQGGQMSCVTQTVVGPNQVHLQAESASQVIGAWAYPQRNGSSVPGEAMDLSVEITGNSVHWTVPEGEWMVSLIFVRSNAFDPLHPESGRLVIEQFYAPFERECPGAIGRSLNLFFQDELDFGSRMPFWSNRLREIFRARHGYDLWPWLPALWNDLGQRTIKIRLDYSDAVVAELEHCYFKPVFSWHQARGTLWGHDNCGRGDMRVGREHYGDYFRTMRWYSAPGCDDPKIQGARSFKGLKVNSSIAHLYQRPRVWAEAFHSSGWGTTPAEVVAAFNEDFAMGANVVNLHGLYYTTYGGWWEWAPPDFHFRQPYWEHCHSLNTYFTRLSWLLSQGVHCCDVAILYPSSVLESEAAPTGAFDIEARIQNSGINACENASLDAESIAFGLGKYLFDRACDFDFIDFESLLRSQMSDGKLSISGENYRVLILPAMSAIRFATLEKIRDFVQAGGLLIAYGCLPVASEREGAKDPRLTALVEEIFGPAIVGSLGFAEKLHATGGRAIYLDRKFSMVLDQINRCIHRDVTVSGSSLQVLHRQIENQEVYYLFNPATQSVSARVSLRARGAVEDWNPWTGESRPLTSLVVEGTASAVQLEFNCREARVLVVQKSRSSSVAFAPTDEIAESIPLNATWRFSVQPTLDNTFGDFRLPPENTMIGPQATRFRYAEEFIERVDWHKPDFDDSKWPETTYSYGPRLLATKPLPPDTDFQSLEKHLVQESGADFLPSRSTISGVEWGNYSISTRWGIERDPFLTHWKSGPHGLKGILPNEFLDFYAETPGTTWYLKTIVESPAAGEGPLVAGGRCAYKVWFNGKLVLEQSQSLPPGLHEPWKIPHYDAEMQKNSVSLNQGANQLLIRLTQPPGQRTRAFVGFTDANLAPTGLALRWFSDPKSLRPSCPASKERKAIWFRFKSPPGTREIQFIARGDVRAWSQGKEIDLAVLGTTTDGSRSYRGVTPSLKSGASSVALRVEAPRDSRAGDALPEPVRFVCGSGVIAVGDWSEYGLDAFSGIGEYSQKLIIPEIAEGDKIILELGEVRATAEVLVDGLSAATLLTPPWRANLTQFLKSGNHELTIRIANTLANYYAHGIPSPYAFQEQNRSGLFGPVKLFMVRKVQNQTQPADPIPNSPQPCQ